MTLVQRVSKEMGYEDVIMQSLTKKYIFAYMIKSVIQELSFIPDNGRTSKLHELLGLKDNERQTGIMHYWYVMPYACLLSNDDIRNFEFKIVQLAEDHWSNVICDAMYTELNEHKPLGFDLYNSSLLWGKIEEAVLTVVTDEDKKEMMQFVNL